MHHQPDGAAFDVVLLLHVGSAVVGLVSMAAAAATASRLRRTLSSPAPLPEQLRHYYRPGFNWAGRFVYGIPVFGFALIAMSDGSYALGDGWVLTGVALFAAVAVLAEGSLWPAESRLKAAVAVLEPTTGPHPAAGPIEHDATTVAPGGCRCARPHPCGDSRHGGATLTRRGRPLVGSPSASCASDAAHRIAKPGAPRGPWPVSRWWR